MKIKVRIKHPLAIIVAIWWLFVWVGIFVSIELWWYLISFVLAYVVADAVYDSIWKKVNPSTKTGIFATYVPTVVLGSFVAVIVSFYSGVTMNVFYTIFPSLSLIYHRVIVSAIGTTLVLLSTWGRALMIHDAIPLKSSVRKR